MVGGHPPNQNMRPGGGALQLNLNAIDEALADLVAPEHQQTSQLLLLRQRQVDLRRRRARDIGVRWSQERSVSPVRSRQPPRPQPGPAVAVPLPPMRYTAMAVRPSAAVLRRSQAIPVDIRLPVARDQTSSQPPSGSHPVATPTEVAFHIDTGGNGEVPVTSPSLSDDSEAAIGGAAHEANVDGDVASELSTVMTSSDTPLTHGQLERLVKRADAAELRRLASVLKSHAHAQQRAALADSPEIHAVHEQVDVGTGGQTPPPLPPPMRLPSAALPHPEDRLGDAATWEAATVSGREFVPGIGPAAALRLQSMNPNVHVRRVDPSAVARRALLLGQARRRAAQELAHSDSEQQTLKRIEALERRSIDRPGSGSRDKQEYVVIEPAPQPLHARVADLLSGRRAIATASVPRADAVPPTQSLVVSNPPFRFDDVPLVPDHALLEVAVAAAGLPLTTSTELPVEILFHPGCRGGDEMAAVPFVPFRVVVITDEWLDAPSMETRGPRERPGEALDRQSGAICDVMTGLRRHLAGGGSPKTSRREGGQRSFDGVRLLARSADSFAVCVPSRAQLVVCYCCSPRQALMKLRDFIKAAPSWDAARGGGGAVRFRVAGWVDHEQEHFDALSGDVIALASTPAISTSNTTPWSHTRIILAYYGALKPGHDLSVLVDAHGSRKDTTGSAESTPSDVRDDVGAFIWKHYFVTFKASRYTRYGMGGSVPSPLRLSTSSVDSSAANSVVIRLFFAPHVNRFLVWERREPPSHRTTAKPSSVHSPQTLRLRVILACASAAVHLAAVLESRLRAGEQCGAVIDPATQRAMAALLPAASLAAVKPHITVSVRPTERHMSDAWLPDAALTVLHTALSRRWTTVLTTLLDRTPQMPDALITEGSAVTDDVLQSHEAVMDRFCLWSYEKPTNIVIFHSNPADFSPLAAHFAPVPTLDDALDAP